MTHVGRKHGPGADELIADAQEYLGPERTAIRQAEIDALPQVVWKGRVLYTLRCRGTSGKGAHDVNVPLVMLWALIELRRYFCPYHAGDAWGPSWDMSISEQVARALELYRLIHLDNQATDSRRAELARLTQTMESREALQYYARVRPLASQLSMTQLLKQAAEETEWS